MRCPRPDGAQHCPAGILFRLVWLPPMSHCFASGGCLSDGSPFSVSDSLFFASSRQLSFNSPFCVKNVPPAAHLSQQLEKRAKEPPEANGLWTPFTLESFIRYGNVVGIDSATDPLPLKRRDMWVYRCTVSLWKPPKRRPASRHCEGAKPRGDPFSTVEQRSPSTAQ